MTVRGAQDASLESDFPDFYRAADETSRDGQRRYVNATRVQLVALVAAALFGAFTLRVDGMGADWAGVGAAVAFLVAALTRGHLWQVRPEKDWYAGRAAAESTKTLAWRFAVAADPFPRDLDEDAATDVFLERLGEIRKKLRNVVIVPPPKAKGEVTPAMLATRARSLGLRKDAYLRQRVAEQRDWYTRKARSKRRRSRQWALAMIVLEICGATGAVLKAAAVVQVDVLGLAGALVAALAAWSEMRQYDNLANAYSVAANELSDIHSRGSRMTHEDEWSAFVSNAEEAISREHTMWVASREA